MKYAITGPKGRIFNVLDEPNDRTVEITDEQAALVAAATPPNGYFVIEGEFITDSEFRKRRRMEAIAALPEAEQAEALAREAGRDARDAASALFDSLSSGEQALWESVRAKVERLFLDGKIAEAKDMLETIPATYEGAEAHRSAFLALLPTT